MWILVEEGKGSRVRASNFSKVSGLVAAVGVVAVLMSGSIPIKKIEGVLRQVIQLLFRPDSSSYVGTNRFKFTGLDFIHLSLYAFLHCGTPERWQV